MIELLNNTGIKKVIFTIIVFSIPISLLSQSNNSRQKESSDYICPYCKEKLKYAYVIIGEKDCIACHGKGRYGYKDLVVSDPCNYCHGTGKNYDRGFRWVCPECQRRFDFDTEKHSHDKNTCLSIIKKVFNKDNSRFFKLTLENICPNKEIIIVTIIQTNIKTNKEESKKIMIRPREKYITPEYYDDSRNNIIIKLDDDVPKQTIK